MYDNPFYYVKIYQTLDICQMCDINAKTHITEVYTGNFTHKKLCQYRIESVLLISHI